MSEKNIYIVRPDCQPLNIYKIEGYCVIRETKNEYCIISDDEEIKVSKNNPNVFEDLSKADERRMKLEEGQSY